MRTDILTEIERHKVMNIKPNYSEIARRMNCDRRTVANYYNGVTGHNRKQSTKKSILDDFIPMVEEKVDSCSASSM